MIIYQSLDQEKWEIRSRRVVTEYMLLCVCSLTIRSGVKFNAP